MLAYGIIFLDRLSMLTRLAKIGKSNLLMALSFLRPDGLSMLTRTDSNALNNEIPMLCY